MKKGILVCCHGTRNPDGVNDTKKLLRFFKKKKDYTVKIGYLEITKPSIKDQLSFFFRKKYDFLLLIPAMIFSGNHVTQDIPKILNNLKKKYTTSPTLFINPPLLKSKKFLKIAQNSLIKKIRMIDNKKDGLIVVASNTVNSKARNEVNYLTKKIAKKNKINFYKRIFITLNKAKLRKDLEKISLKHSKFLILPLFLFRGNLLENLILTIQESNEKGNKRFFLCSHLNNYKEIYNVINSSIKS